MTDPQRLSHFRERLNAYYSTILTGQSIEEILSDASECFDPLNQDNSKAETKQPEQKPWKVLEALPSQDLTDLVRLQAETIGRLAKAVEKMIRNDTK